MTDFDFIFLLINVDEFLITRNKMHSLIVLQMKLKCAFPWMHFKIYLIIYRALLNIHLNIYIYIYIYILEISLWLCFNF